MRANLTVAQWTMSDEVLLVDFLDFLHEHRAA